MAGDRTRQQVCGALRPFGTSIFTEMTTLSERHGAVNLSQGFPDFDGPLEIRQRAAEEIRKGPNQYAPSIGVPALRQAVAAKLKRFHSLEIDPDTEVTVTAGATEGLAAALLGLLEPGDEVILLEPFYDLYPAVVARAGARPVYVPLDRPGFGLPEEALERAFSRRTRAIIINNPQNPCGKVYTRDELLIISRLCQAHDALAIGDEVYEHLVYDGRAHETLLKIPGLEDRALVISSTAKTFSMTGWKVGYVVAPPPLTEAVRMAHQFLTYCTSAAFQNAMAVALAMDDSYYAQLLESYTRRRDLLHDALSGVGFHALVPEGTYYITVQIDDLEFADDLTFCRYLAADVGVAAIPESYFFSGRQGGRDLVRFCFCKEEATLLQAKERLTNWKKEKR